MCNYIKRYFSNQVYRDSDLYFAFFIKTYIQLFIHIKLSFEIVRTVGFSVHFVI